MPACVVARSAQASHHILQGSFGVEQRLQVAARTSTFELGAFHAGAGPAMRFPPLRKPHQPLDIGIVGRNDPALERFELLLPRPINFLKARNSGLAVIALAY